LYNSTSEQELHRDGTLGGSAENSSSAPMGLDQLPHGFHSYELNSSYYEEFNQV
jgi:hypothetical protein